MTCAANGLPHSFVATSYDNNPTTLGWHVFAQCNGRFAPERQLCADNGHLRSPFDTLWQCSGVALADQDAANALGVQFSQLCNDGMQAPVPFDESVVPNGTGVLATYTCTNPFEPPV